MGLRTQLTSFFPSFLSDSILFLYRNHLRITLWHSLSGCPAGCQQTWDRIQQFPSEQQRGNRVPALPLAVACTLRSPSPRSGMGHAPSQFLISGLMLTQRRDPRDTFGSSVSPEFCLFSWPLCSSLSLLLYVQFFITCHLCKRRKGHCQSHPACSRSQFLPQVELSKTGLWK